MTQTDPNSAPPGADDPTAVLPSDAFRPEIAALEQQLAEARAKADEHYALYVRALAEMENVRKRGVKDLEQAHRYAVEKFAQELLPVLDGFELAQANAAAVDAKSLLEGQAATLRLLLKAFEKAGIAELQPTGQPFNPDQHEAMVAQPNADVAPNTVLQTVQKGYVLNGRVLRPARVVVSRAP
jgi:molecular chaperone GrpE